MDLSVDETQIFRPGEALFSAGNVPVQAYVVLTGRVGLGDEDDGAPVIAGPGEIVGEIDLLLGQPHNATVVALEPVAVYPLTHRQLAAAMKDAPSRTIAHAGKVLADLARQILAAYAETAVPGSGEMSVSPAGVENWRRIRLSTLSPDLVRHLDGVEIHRPDLPFIVGRKPGRRENAPRQPIDLILPDRKPYNMSRRHFELSNTPEGLALRDLGSLLGTEVNGARIGSGKSSNSALLHTGPNGVIAGGARSPFRLTIDVEVD